MYKKLNPTTDVIFLRVTKDELTLIETAFIEANKDRTRNEFIRRLLRELLQN